MDDADSIELIRTAGRGGAERRALERRVERGELIRVRAGVLADRRCAEHLDARARHRLLVRASTSLVRPGRAISHLSAAAMYRWPHVGEWPDRVHLTDTATPRTRVTPTLVLHGGRSAPPPLHPRTLDGAGVVSIARTVVDLAKALPLAESLPIIDHVLRTADVGVDDLRRELDTTSGHARTRAARALDLGSGASESPGESLCRVRFVELGAPTPIQQQRFVRAGERTVRVDFWFPDQGVIVEFDGRIKYDDPDAHWREKRREDHLRSFPEVRIVVRFTWADLMHPDRMRAALRRVGIPCN